MTIEDINSVLYQFLTSLNLDISGGIYFDSERPYDSDKEDIVINTPSLTGGHGHPQRGYSNINIYVPSLRIKADGQQRLVRNRTRESELVTAIETAVTESLRTKGVASVESESKEQSADGSESFVNIRITWRIYYL